MLGCLMAVAEGCAAHRAPAVGPPPALKGPGMTFVATAYCQRGTTASGIGVRQGIVAADPRVFSLGTRIRVEATGNYDGVYRVLDTGPKVRGHRIDLFIADCGEARRFGRRSVRVTVVDLGPV